MTVNVRARALFVLLMISLSTPAGAESVMSISLVEDPWPPYIEGRIGEPASGGKLIELYRELFERIEGVEVQYLLMPWKRALVEVERGRQDGILALFKSAERTAVMDFTAPIFTGRTMLWYAKSKYPAPIDWETMDDLRQYNIVALRGSAMARPLHDAVAGGVPLSIIDVYYMAFSKKSPARHLIPRINAIIEDMHEEGLISRILLGESTVD